MNRTHYTIRGTLWLYPSEKANWYFVTIPKKETEAINVAYKHMKRGWGSLPCEVSLGKTKWTTSIFPETKSQIYLLPIKALVRKNEGVAEGDTITLKLSIRV